MEGLERKKRKLCQNEIQSVARKVDVCTMLNMRLVCKDWKRWLDKDGIGQKLIMNKTLPLLSEAMIQYMPKKSKPLSNDVLKKSRSYVLRMFAQCSYDERMFMLIVGLFYSLKVMSVERKRKPGHKPYLDITVFGDGVDIYFIQPATSGNIFMSSEYNIWSGAWYEDQGGSRVETFKLYDILQRYNDLLSGEKDKGLIK